MTEENKSQPNVDIYNEMAPDEFDLNLPGDSLVTPQGAPLEVRAFPVVDPSTPAPAVPPVSVNTELLTIPGTTDPLHPVVMPETSYASTLPPSQPLNMAPAPAAMYTEPGVHYIGIDGNTYSATQVALKGSAATTQPMTPATQAALAAQLGVEFDPETQELVAKIPGVWDPVTGNDALVSRKISYTIRGKDALDSEAIGSYTSSLGGAVQSLAKQGFGDASVIAAAQDRVAPVSPSADTNARVTSLESTSIALAQEAAKIDEFLLTNGNKLSDQEKSDLAATRDGFNRASSLASQQKSAFLEAAASPAGQKATAAAAGDYAKFGVTPQEYAVASSKIDTELEVLAAAAKGTSDPTTLAMLSRQTQSRIDSIKAQLQQEDPTKGYGVARYNYLGEYMGLKPEMVIAAAGVGLSLYQALYATPEEARKRRDFELQLLKMQQDFQKDLQSAAISADLEIASIQAEASVAAAAAANEKGGTPPAPNPAINL